MSDRPRKNIGDRLDAAVRVPGKAGQIVSRPIAPEVVKEQERVELRRAAEAKATMQLDAGALKGRLRRHNA